MGLLNTNFFLNFIGRSLIYVFVQCFLVYERSQFREGISIKSVVAMRLCAYLLVEVIFYVQQKVQAKIFLSKIKIKQQ